MGDFGGPGGLGDRDEWMAASEVWDPALGRNVYAPEGIGAYILNALANYQGYTGAVTHAGRESRPISTAAFTAPAPPPKPSRAGAPAPPDYARYRAAAERQALEGPNANPFHQGEMDAVLAQAREQARVLPGVRPNIGYIPGAGGLNLFNFLPFEAWENAAERRGRSRIHDISPTEQALVDFFSARPQIEFPTFQTASNAENPFRGFPGRGFELRGAPSAREAELATEIQAGRINPRLMQEYDALRRPRQQVVPLSQMQEYATRYYGPAIMMAGSMLAGPAVGGLGGAMLAAGAGALGTGAMTRWQDPAALAIGAGAGALGGWGAGVGAQAAGASPMLTGAAGGAGGAIASSVGRGAVQGEVNPMDVVRSGATGAAVGSAAGSTGLPGQVFAPAANVGADMVWPRDRRRRNPFER